MVRFWYAGSAEERMMQLLRLINGLLEKHPESHSRKLAAHAPIIVPVYSQVPSAVYLYWWQAVIINQN